jgi:hypothetical protein
MTRFKTLTDAEADRILASEEEPADGLLRAVDEILTVRRLEQPRVQLGDLDLPPDGTVHVTYWPRTSEAAVAIVRAIPATWTTERSTETLEMLRCSHNGVAIDIYYPVPERGRETTTPYADAIIAEAKS